MIIMEQLVKKLLVVVGISLNTANALAYDFEANGIYYNILSVQDKTVEVVGSYNSDLGDVVIPEQVQYNEELYRVTSIGNGAFSGCSSLASVTIPESVTSIGYSAFEDCSSLTSVNISDLSAWCRIDFGVYGANPLDYAHNLYLNGVLVTDLVIPKDISEIKSDAFSGGSCITSVIIPNSVTSIGVCAFRSCSRLESVTIPESVTSIGYLAFSGCSGLTSVNISDLSAWCRIDFGDYYATPLIYAHNLYLNGALVTDLVIPKDISEIKSDAFSGGSCITSVTIPESVTSIGSSAFSGCSAAA